MAPTQLSIVLGGLLNELGTADLSTLEAMLKHDTGAVLDAIRSTALQPQRLVRRLMPARPRAMLLCPHAQAALLPLA